MKFAQVVLCPWLFVFGFCLLIPGAMYWAATVPIPCQGSEMSEEPEGEPGEEESQADEQSSLQSEGS